MGILNPERSIHAAAGLCLLAFVSACGGEGKAENAASGNDTESENGVDIAAAESPEQIGEAVANLYVGALKDVGEALANHPAPDAAAEMLVSLRERYVQDLVTLGRRIQAMSVSDRATVQGAVSSAQRNLRYDETLKPVWDRYQAIQTHYIESGAASSNPEFWDLLQSFNVITQYAFFDLLKRQSPDEAERLGV